MWYACRYIAAKKKREEAHFRVDIVISQLKKPQHTALISNCYPLVPEKSEERRQNDANWFQFHKMVRGFFEPWNSISIDMFDSFMNWQRANALFIYQSDNKCQSEESTTTHKIRCHLN